MTLITLQIIGVVPLVRDWTFQTLAGKWYWYGPNYGISDSQLESFWKHENTLHAQDEVFFVRKASR